MSMVRWGVWVLWGVSIPKQEIERLQASPNPVGPRGSISRGRVTAHATCAGAHTLTFPL